MVIVWNWDGDGGRVFLFAADIVVEAAARGASSYFGEDGLVEGGKGGHSGGVEGCDDGGAGEDMGVC